MGAKPSRAKTCVPSGKTGLAVLIVLRILNEETVLARELPGYVEYCGKVRYRLVPGIW